MLNYSNMNYMDALRRTDSASLSFDCEYPCEFLDSLAKDGYDEFLRTQSEYVQSRVKGGSTSDSCTGGIYISERNCYGKISIHKYTSNKFGIDIEIRPAAFGVKEEKNLFLTYLSKSIDTMAGIHNKIK